MKRYIYILYLLPLLSCTNETKHGKNPGEQQAAQAAVRHISYSVVASYPHDINSFTEGLLFHEGKLYESTGSPDYLPQTRSLAGILDLKTGKIDKKVELDRDEYFGEGIVFLKGKLYQLTYDTKLGFEYDAKTFKKLREFSFPSKEGWGMTTDGTHLIMSDGTNQLSYLDPADFKVIRTVQVSEEGYAKDYINELEYINGYIYANIWMTHVIVKIDPKDGKVVARLDLSSQVNEVKAKHKAAQEMNGIAYNPDSKTVFVTGKMWPTVYEIKFDL